MAWSAPTPDPDTEHTSDLYTYVVELTLQTAEGPVYATAKIPNTGDYGYFPAPVLEPALEALLALLADSPLVSAQVRRGLGVSQILAPAPPA
ncbi:hypothetical protein [Promicromonospora kroppenstedtii]|uniref:hypothetical protein n=1 Tax=Promicromonospora kroppenstedtii TaxID=440482 RepID=UPI0004BC1EAA|nr:hypothetical protein [Promicromonospora kroppenstedtii]